MHASQEDGISNQYNEEAYEQKNKGSVVAFIDIL